MKTHTVKPTDLTIVLPMEDGTALEINCSNHAVKEFVAPALLVERLRKRCTAVATSNDYNLLVLDF